MGSLVSDIGTGVVVFASTNIDDLFLLAAFFGDPRVRGRAVIIGQFLGIGALVTVSALAALLALAVPEGWIALLGFVPLYLGLRKVVALRKGSNDEESSSEQHRLQNQERDAETRIQSQAFAVAAITFANGGDNLGVYIPLFATALNAVAAYALIFAAMTGVWCYLGHMLVNNRVLVAPLRRFAHLALPPVLIGLGLYILSGAASLLR
ncbi:MAG: cadmium resistance transporter [Betaproteobacteria bacterium]|nr:cadmium resistance transporter [Betaproteobacteria bacterium]